jgi:hypothetical protein
MDVYFAQQQEKLGVHALEDFEEKHADQMARDQLRKFQTANISF